MRPGLVEEPPSPFASYPPACSSERTFLCKSSDRGRRRRRNRLVARALINGSTFGSLQFLGELFIQGNKMKPFNFKRNSQGFPVPRAETQYPHRHDKHQLSEGQCTGALHAGGYRGGGEGNGGEICFRGNQSVLHYPKRRVGEQLLSSFAWEPYLPFPSTVFR